MINVINTDDNLSLMKKILSKLSFCSVILLSAVCFFYINTTELRVETTKSDITEIQTPNDRMIGSVKTATVLFSKVFAVITNQR